ncbi:MAG: hypothetical protein K940chlam2_01056 [Chlamydiae bacterium]|nr:hypothetical protein [Chlamydiota bacterium]
MKLGQGLAKRTDMPTAIEAGKRKEASGTGNTDGASGLAVLKTGNFTDLEVAGILEWGDPSKWGRRRVELARMGTIRLTGEKRNGSAVWKLVG